MQHRHLPFPQHASTTMASSSISSPVDEEDEHQTGVMAVANARHEVQLPAFALCHMLSHDDPKALLSDSSFNESPQERHSTKRLVDDDTNSSSESNDRSKKPPAKPSTKNFLTFYLKAIN